MASADSSPWRAHLHALLATLPAGPSATYPDGVPFIDAISHGSMSVELFQPKGEDLQQPHDQDELYVVVAGRASFERDGERVECASGDALFVPAGMRHRFHDMEDDFATWVIFWGPLGGDTP